MAILKSQSVYRITCKLSGLCLAVSGASYDNAARVLQWTWSNSQEQKWRAESIGGDAYRFSPLHAADKRMAVLGDWRNAGNGSWVGQWTPTEGSEQIFKLFDVGGGYFNIRPQNSGLNLDIEGANSNNGSKCVTWESTGGDNQKFGFIEVT